MIKKRVVIGVTAAAAILLWVAVNLLVVTKSAGLVERRFPVVIGKVRSNFLGSFVFEDVRLSSPVEATLPRLRASFRPPNSIVFRSESQEWGRINGVFQILFRSGFPWTFSASSEDVPLENITPLLKNKFPETAALKGNVRLDVEMGFGKPWIVKAAGQKLVWRRPAGEPAIPFAIDLKATEKEIDIISSRFLSAVTVKGRVSAPWDDAKLALTARADDLPVGRITKSPATGSISFLANIEGTVKHPRADGSADFKIGYGDVRFPPAQGTFQFKDDSLVITADFADGRVLLNGSLPKSKSPRWLAKVENLSLNKIALENDWRNVGGTLDSDVSVSAGENGPIIDGVLTLAGFSWGRFKSSKTVHGKIHVNDRLVRVDADALALKVQIKNDVARVDEFRLSFAKDSRLSAKGIVRTDDKTVDLKINGKNIPPDLWPPLVARYPAITGNLDMEGSVHGPWKNPSTENSVSFDQLRFIPSGKAWSGKARLSADKKEIALSDIRVEGGYMGELSLALDSPKPVVQMSVQLNNADPQLLFDVFKSTLESRGALDGSAELQFRDNKAVGSAGFTWSAGGVVDFPFDKAAAKIVLNGTDATVEQFSLNQGARAVQGSGQASMGTEHVKFSSNVQLQKWGGPSLVMDGEASIDGRYAYKEKKLTMTVATPLIWVNEIPFENVSADVKRDSEKWALSGDAADGFAISATFRHKSQYVDGTLRGKNLNLGDLFARAMPNVQDLPVGKANGEIHFYGLPAALAFEGSLGMEDVVFRGEELSANAILKVSTAAISFSKFDGRLASGGTFSLRGAIPRNSQGNYSFDGTAKALNLQSVFHLLNWPVTWAGRGDAEFSMLSHGGKRESKISFKGKHDGFGPFPGKGNFTGVIRESNGQWDLSGIRVESDDGYAVLLPGSQIYSDKDGTSTMRVLGDTRNLRAGVLSFFGGLELTGTWRGRSQFEPKDVDRPIELDVFARSLWVNQYVLDGNVSHLTLRKGEMEFSPIRGTDQQLSGLLIHKNFPELLVKDFRLNDSGLEKIYLNGLVGPDKWDFQLNLKKVDAGLIRNLLDTNLPVSGTMDAQIQGKGNVKHPQLSGPIVLEPGYFDLVPVDKAEGDLSYVNNIVELKNFRAVKKKGFQAYGWVRFQTGDDENKQPPEIDITVDKGDMTFFHEMWPEVTRARGSFNGRFRMLTKSWGASVSGFLNAQKISMSTPYTPDLDKGEISVRLDKNRLHFEKARARLEKGHIGLSGYVDFQGGRPNFYNLILRNEDEDGITVRVPELSILPGPFLGQFGILKKRLAGASKGELLLNLILKGTADAPLLAGTVELENTVFTYPPSATSRGARNTAFSRWLKDFVSRLKCDVSVVAGSRTWYQNELVDASIRGSIQFEGLAGDLNVNGKIQSDQGSIVYSGSEFKLKDAVLELETVPPAAGETKHTSVYLRASAEKQVYYTDGLSNNNQDIIVMVVDRSLLGEIQPRFYSRYNPNLSSQRALQLALGLPFSDSVDTNNLLPDQRIANQQSDRTENDKLLRLGLVQLLDASLATPLARAIARNTGLVDTIRITYQEKDPLADNSVAVGEAASSNNITENQFLKYAKGTKVRFGRGLSSRLFADYSVRVDEFQNQVDLRHEVELSYQLKRNLYLRGISELDNSRQLGRVPDRRAILENQWRFGLPKPKTPGKPPRESRAPDDEHPDDG